MLEQAAGEEGAKTWHTGRPSLTGTDSSSQERGQQRLRCQGGTEGKIGRKFLAKEKAPSAREGEATGWRVREWWKYETVL